mmetsp:Transcript_84/g.117  ORF Transcript_84/g.117 Transcript_84/m.117 type:complete len:88 (-) Transcript_84:118-381(-)
MVRGTLSWSEFESNCSGYQKRGKSNKKTGGLARKTLLALLYLVKHSDNGYEERAVILILFHAVGRGSEVAATTWESAEWDDDRQPTL